MRGGAATAIIKVFVTGDELPSSGRLADFPDHEPAARAVAKGGAGGGG